MSKSANSKGKNFEQSLEGLEGIVEKLESGELPLDESLALFENGVKIYKECKTQLEKAEKKISKLNDSLKEEEVSD